MSKKSKVTKAVNPIYLKPNICINIKSFSFAERKYCKTYRRVNVIDVRFTSVGIRICIKKLK